MKLVPTFRQPFLGLALAAAAGISLSDFVRPSNTILVIGCVAAAALAAVLLVCPHVSLTYVFVVFSFFLLHDLRTSRTAGLSLASRLGERSRVVTATGAVASEPKLAENGTASFLLRLNRIEVEGKTEAS